MIRRFSGKNVSIVSIIYVFPEIPGRLGPQEGPVLAVELVGRVELVLPIKQEILEYQDGKEGKPKE